MGHIKGIPRTKGRVFMFMFIGKQIRNSPKNLEPAVYHPHIMSFRRINDDQINKPHVHMQQLILNLGE